MPIVNDNIAEDTEDFFSTLTTTDPDVFLGPDEARAIILEDTSDRKFYKTFCTNALSLYNYWSLYSTMFSSSYPDFCF